jgi:enoyl-CoA hydratase/carnithine racemase
MSEAEKIGYEKDGRIGVITLRRPETRNAIDPEMDGRLQEIWSDFRDDDDLDIAIWTGTGNAFCSGADRNTWFTQFLEADSLTVRDVAAGIGFGGLTRGLHRIYKPVIAAVNGWALGGGLELALACDIRIASERAMFGTPLVRFGFHHGDGGISRLVNCCGSAVALDLELTGQPIDAERARQCNLITRIVPHDRLMAEARAVAEAILENEQVAVRSAKQTVLDVVGRDLDDQLEREALNSYSLGARSREIVEALQTS